MREILTRAFLLASLERCLKTFAQTAVALLSSDAVGLFDVNWASVASAAGMAAVVSLLTSVASSGVGNVGPSLSRSEVLSPPAPVIEADPEGNHAAP